MKHEIYKSLYEHKLISIEDAINFVKSDMNLVVGMCASEPQGIMKNLHLVKDRVKNVNIFSVLTLSPFEFYCNPEMKGHFKLTSWFHGPYARKALADKTGTVTYVPNMLHLCVSDFLHARKPNILFGTCTPPDRHGYVSLSLGITYEKDIAERADLVILEINENLPRTFGDTQMHISQVNYFVEHNGDIPTLPKVTPDEIENRIGQNIAELVEDESTIQLGFGGIPNAAALSLKHKKNLGVHTEMFVDSMMDLYEMGVITNRKKAFQKDKFITTFAMGTTKLYEWLHENVAVNFQRGNWVNYPHNISQNSKMVSINTCLSVDFSGQVCSESLGINQFSGTGGQSDTAIGAKSGFDGKGKSIIACRSTAKNDTISTITPTLMNGSAVTLHRSNTDYIVTEYGIAALRGRTIEERTKALIAVAHPKFREQLIEEARKMNYV